MNKQIFVKDIAKENISVDDLFIAVKKGIFSSKNNTRYMSVTLRDKTGTIEGKVWDNVDRIDGQFEKDDLVFVKSRSRIFQEKPQLNISDIRKAGPDLSLDDLRAFYPGSEAGSDQLNNEYNKTISEIRHPHLRSLLDVFNSRKDLLERFFVVPASIGVHHVYIGGLLEHSLSVAKMGRQAAETVGADADIVSAGSLLHDIGKIEEITVKGGFKYSDEGRLLGHITLGVILLDELIKGIRGFPVPLGDVLKHIVISHHGMEEWGSPRRPMCIEALIVHYLDNLDAKVVGVKEHMRDNMEDEKWTEYHRLYESRFYRLPEGNHGD
jgi:3'-5' exoribonuclease